MNASLYAPTFAQRALLTEYSLHPGNEALDLLFVFRIEGRLDRSRLCRAVAAVMTGADGLNTRFEQLAGQWVALVDPRPFVVREVDLRVQGQAADRAAVVYAETDLAGGRIAPADPEQIRITLLTTPGEVCYVYLRAGHLIGDAYTFYCLMAAVSTAFQTPEDQWPDLVRLVGGHPGSVAPAQVTPAARAGYARLLGDCAGLLHPELDVRRAGDRILGRHVPLVIDGSEADLIRSSWSVERHRTASTFFAAYAAVLHRLNPRREVVLGVPLANRAGGPAKRALGYFVNTLPLPVRVDADTRWEDLCEQVGRGVRVLQSVQGLDLADPGNRDLCPPPGPATDNAVTFYKQAMLLDLPGVRVTALPLERRAITHPLSLNVADDGATYTLDLSVADHLSATAPMDLLREAVRDLATGPGGRVVGRSVFQIPSQIPAQGSSKVREQAPAQATATGRTPARPGDDAALTQALSRSCTTHPQRVALRQGDTEVTYGDLWGRVLAAAAALDFSEATEHVMVRMEKSIDAVVAMLAVICSGRVYVPVDPGAPVERARAIEERIRRAQGRTPTVLAGIRSRPAPDGYRLPVLSAERIAYVIFTSGSTGEPKGVAVPHGNVVDLLHSTAERFDLAQTDVWCLFHSLAFDFSVWEIFGPLLTGGTLVIPEPDQVRDPIAFQEFLDRERVTVLNQTPSAFRRLCAALTGTGGGADLSSVRLIVFGGEALFPADLKPWRSVVGRRARAVNMYGITETTVHVTARELSLEDEQEERRSPIGEPLEHLGLLLVDEYGRPALPGRPGEILVTGTGLAQGYLADPELTAARFPLICRDGRVERCYRTGDLACRDGGELVYLGRRDDQVQLRGHRIELGEVQAALLALPTVSACVVRLVTGSGTEPFLAAWVSGGSASDLAVVRAALQHRIPGYMVPSRFTWVPSIPTNQNGKPDLAALDLIATAPPQPRRHEPSRDGTDQLTRAEAPGERPAAQENDLAHRIALIWAQVIGSGPVDVHDQYSEVGGTSMHLLAIHEQLRAEPEVGEFSLVDVYEYPTPAALAERLTRADQGESVLHHSRQV